MPAVFPENLKVGQRYTRVHRTNPRVRRATQPFHSRREEVFNDGEFESYVVFNSGGGATTEVNPDSFNFYAEGNANIPAEYMGGLRRARRRATRRKATRKNRRKTTMRK